MVPWRHPRARRVGLRHATRPDGPSGSRGGVRYAKLFEVFYIGPRHVTKAYGPARNPSSPAPCSDHGREETRLVPGSRCYRREGRGLPHLLAFGDWRFTLDQKTMQATLHGKSARGMSFCHHIDIIRFVSAPSRAVQQTTPYEGARPTHEARRRDRLPAILASVSRPGVLSSKRHHMRAGASRMAAWLAPCPANGTI